MPRKERIPDTPISDDLLLAAIERAEHHGGHENQPGIDLSTVKEHLGLPHHGGITLKLRPQLAALENAGLIQRFRRKDHNLMTLTTTGRARLDAVRDEIGPLPEAPQHKAWREARAAARERIAGFRSDLRSALDEAIHLLDADHDADSATWYELSDRLHHAGRLFASATHCLHEWPEPDDSHIDNDDPPHRQRGRRQIGGWDSEFRF